VSEGPGPFGGKVLNQRPFSIDVQTLASEANGEYGFAGLERVVEDSKIGAVAIFIYLVGFRMLSYAVTRGIDVGRAAGKDKAVQVSELGE
jgi:hypothetical protein